MLIEQPPTQTTSNSFELPTIRCRVHLEPPGFVCINPDTKQNMFLCSRCMLSEYRNYDKRDTCVVLNDFTNSLKSFANGNLSEPTVQDEFMQPILNAQSLFLQHIENLRSELANFLIELQNQYVLAFQSIQTNLELIVNEELTKFNNLCNKLVKLNSTSNHNSFPTFTEIEQNISSFRDQIQIEEYVRDLLRKKLQVEKIGSSLNNLSQQQNVHFTNELNKIVNNLPKMSNQDEVLQIWRKNLEKGAKTIAKLGREKIFTNLSDITACPLTIQKPEDLFLLTKEQLEFYTQINFQFEEEWNQNDVSTCISRLGNLQDLVSNIAIKLSNWPNDAANQFLEQLKEVSKNVRTFEFTMQDEHVSKNLLNNLSGLISGITLVENLKLGFENCSLSGQGLKIIGNLIESQKDNLKSLDLNLKHNLINGSSLNSMSEGIHECSFLKSLKININGFSAKQNSIELDEFKLFFESLKNIGTLQHLSLGIGDCELDKKGTIYLSRLLSETSSISQLTLDLYNTRQTEESIKKLIEVMNYKFLLILQAFQSLTTLDYLKVNLNNNPKIGNEGYNQLIQFQQANESKFQVLDLKFRNIGVEKDANASKQANLNKQS